MQSHIFQATRPSHHFLPAQSTINLSLKADVGHCNRMHLYTAPGPGRSSGSGPPCPTPTWGHHQMPHTWKPQAHLDSSSAGRPQSLQEHGQMVPTQSNSQQADLARYLSHKPAFARGWSASKNHVRHNLYQLRASLFGSDIYFRNVKKFLEKCGDKMNRLFILHIDIPDFSLSSTFSCNKKCTKLALLVLTTTREIYQLHDLLKCQGFKVKIGSGQVLILLMFSW